MNENIRESHRMWIWSVSVILCGLAGTWWGIRTGRGLGLITRTELEPACCAAMLLALLIQGLSNLKKDGRYPMIYRILVWYSGIMVPVLIYGLGCMVLLDIISWISRGALPLNYDVNAAIALPFSLVILLCGLIHARRIKIRKYTIRLAGLPEDLQPCRIVQLSDLHMGVVVGTGHVRKVLQKTQELHPAYVMLTGDTFNHGFVEECLHPEKAAEAFRELNHALVMDAEHLHGQQPAGSENHSLVADSGYSLDHQSAGSESPTLVADAGQGRQAVDNVVGAKISGSAQSAVTMHTQEPASASRQQNSQPDKTHKKRHKPENQEGLEGNSVHREPSRIFAVLGNHDPLPADPALQKFLKDANITLLHDRTISLPQFFLAGRGGNHISPRPALADWLPDHHPEEACSPEENRITEEGCIPEEACSPDDSPHHKQNTKAADRKIRKTVHATKTITTAESISTAESMSSTEKKSKPDSRSKQALSREKPLILLDHYPDGVYEAQALHVDLMLSGHTHGGQYFPCDLLIRKHYAHGRLVHGYSVWGNTQSIVSSGAGFFQIPIRIGTSSEIVCIDLEGNKDE